MIGVPGPLRHTFAAAGIVHADDQTRRSRLCQSVETQFMPVKDIFACAPAARGSRSPRRYAVAPGDDLSLVIEQMHKDCIAPLRGAGPGLPDQRDLKRIVVPAEGSASA